MLLATATAVLYSPRKSSLESSRAPSERTPSPSVACLRTDIFSFRSYWHKGSALVCTYVGTSHTARQKLRLSEQTKRPTRALTTALDLSSLLPPSFDLETPESINGSSDFMFLKCRGVRRSVMRPRFSWGFSRNGVARYELHRKILVSPSFSREECGRPKSENSDGLPCAWVQTTLFAIKTLMVQRRISINQYISFINYIIHYIIC